MDHDVVNQIFHFSSRISRFHKLQYGSVGGRRATKDKKSVKINSRKTNVFNEQVCYAFRVALQDLQSKPLATLLTVIIISIFLTLLSSCYMVYKNVNHAAATQPYHPSPKIVVYMKKMLDDDAAGHVVAQLQAEDGVEKVNYLSSEDVLRAVCNCCWSLFNGVLDMLLEEQNHQPPLPAVAVILPKTDFQNTDSLNNLCDRVAHIHGVNKVSKLSIDFARLAAFTWLVGCISLIISVLMGIAVLIIIGNSVRLSLFSCRDTINVQKLIGATDSFILRPFSYNGALLGFSGAFLSVILSEIFVLWFSSVFTEVVQLLVNNFNFIVLSLDEYLLMLLVCTMTGWLAAWLTTVQHLRRQSTIE